MGLYRLILAAMVALSHSRAWSWNPGIVAVISFYLLSGYVMTMLIEKHYPRAAAVPYFYLDRAARLFPQFLFYAAIATVCVAFLHIESIFTKGLTPLKWFLDLFILPQGFYMWLGGDALLIPQAWSLGLEMTFYIVIPWIIVLLPRGGLVVLSTVSIAVFLLAYFGVIDSDVWGYRLLPGTLFMFLTGASFVETTPLMRSLRIGVLALATLLLVFAMKAPTLYARPFNKEVLLGLVLGIVAIWLMSGKRFSRVDEFLGNLSYGVFLNHFIVIWLMQKYLHVRVFGVAQFALLLGLACVLALVSYSVVELPALRWRHRIRASKKRTTAPFVAAIPAASLTGESHRG